MIPTHRMEVEDTRSSDVTAFQPSGGCSCKLSADALTAIAKSEPVSCARPDAHALIERWSLSSGMRWYGRVLCTVGLAATFSPEEAIGQGLSICNNTPFNYQAVIAKPLYSGLVPNGWFRLKPGECARPSLMIDFEGGMYFRRAEVLRSDTIASWLEADFDVDGWVSICASRQRFDGNTWHERENAFAQCNVGKIWFERGFVKSSKVRNGDGVWSIEHDAFPVRNAEDARRWRRWLAGRKAYEDVILPGAGNPFRLGVMLRADGVVEVVHDGLPAHAAGIRPGDQIYAIGNTRVDSNGDIVRTLQSIGYNHGFDTEVRVAWIRAGTAMYGWAPLEYYHELDTRLTPEQRREAFVDGAWDSVWLGFGERAACLIGSAAMDVERGLDGDGWRLENTIKRTGECTEAENARRRDQGIQFPDEVRAGEITGAFASVYRGMIGGLRLIQSRTAARIAQSGAVARLFRNVIIEAGEGVVHTVGTRAEGETPEQTFDRLWNAGAFGAGIGIVTTRLR